MAAPKFRPATESTKAYESPAHVPSAWTASRPGDIGGFQPSGVALGSPGPDQGFALRIAERLRDHLELQEGENADDAIRGCLGVALKRASIYSRAPVVHDLTIAFTIWGFLDSSPPTDLVDLRRPMFEGLRHVGHHYSESRAVVDAVPVETLTMTPDQVSDRYPADWRDLLGV